MPTIGTGITKEFDDELALEMYKMTHEYLSGAGYVHYEISNYAKPGYQTVITRHTGVANHIWVWEGAHSFLPPERIENVEDITTYLEMVQKNQFPQAACEKQTPNMAMSEAMFMGLRLLEGVNLKDFYHRFDQDPRVVFKEAIAKCLNNGLIEIDSKEYLKLTPQGIFLGNLVFEEFLLNN